MWRTYVLALYIYFVAFRITIIENLNHTFISMGEICFCHFQIELIFIHILYFYHFKITGTLPFHNLMVISM